nr:hypothetical protein [Terriglobales bacterium]
MQAYRWLIRCGVLVVVLAGAALAADNVVLVTSQASQGSNDSASWSSAGKDGSVLGASFSLTSTNKMAITASLQGANSVTSVVCPASSCSWTTSANGIKAGDTLLWTSDAGAGGNGPLTLNFATSVSGVGASLQADAPGPFTASLQVFNGATSLGSFTVKSDASGNPVYIGALDKTASKITSAVFSVTGCAAVCSDFAIDTLSMNEPVADYSMSGTTAGAIDAGQTATYTVTVTPAAGFHQPVSLA